MFAQQAAQVINTEQSRTTSKFPADSVTFVSRNELKYIDDLTYTVDMAGQVHYCARIIPQGGRSETDGDFDIRARNARVELERYFIDRGFKFALDRDTSLSAAHRTEDSNIDFLGNLEARLLFGTVKPQQGKSQSIIPASKKAIPYQFTPESHRKEIEMFEREIGAELAKVEVTSKGYAINNSSFVCPNFRPGLRSHDGINTTWQDFSAMVVTNQAALADNYPDLYIYTRSSLMKDSLAGVPSAVTPMEWFGLSSQMKVTGVAGFTDLKTASEIQSRQEEIRDQIKSLQTTDRKRRADGTLEPYTTSVISIPELTNKQIDVRRERYRACRMSPPNPESKEMLCRIISPGESPGELDNSAFGMHTLKQLKRHLMICLDHIEEYGEDLSLTEKQKAESQDSQIAFSTMTLSKVSGTPAYSGREFHTEENITWTANSPSKQLSNAWLTKTYRMPDGNPIKMYFDKVEGRMMYHEPYSEHEMYSTRDKYNRAVARGQFGKYGGGGKWLSSEAPNDMEMSPEDGEMLAVIRYANFMDKDFQRHGYFFDPITADIQSLGFEHHGLKRIMIFFPGVDKKIRSGEKPISQEVKGWSDLIHFKSDGKNGLVEYSGLNASVKDQFNVKEKKRETGFNGVEFKVFRQPDGRWPWFDRDSPYFVFPESKFHDQREAGLVEWVEGELKYDGKEKESAGYLFYEQYAGIDYELPLHNYLTYFELAIANIYDEVYEEVQKVLPPELWDQVQIEIHQTDAVRKWAEFYKLIRFLDDVRDYVSNNTSEVFHQVTNETLRRKGHTELLSPLEFDVAVAPEKIFTLYRHGSEKKEETDLYFNKALEAYKEKLYQAGFSQEVVKEISDACISNKYLYTAKLDSRKLGGPESDPLIKDSFSSAITFRIGISARVKVKLPDQNGQKHKVEEESIPRPVILYDPNQENSIKALIEEGRDDELVSVSQEIKRKIVDDFSSHLLSDASKKMSGILEPLFNTSSYSFYNVRIAMNPLIEKLKILNESPHFSDVMQKYFSLSEAEDQELKGLLNEYLNPAGDEYKRRVELANRKVLSILLHEEEVEPEDFSSIVKSTNTRLPTVKAVEEQATLQDAAEIYLNIPNGYSVLMNDLKYVARNLIMSRFKKETPNVGIAKFSEIESILKSITENNFS